MSSTNTLVANDVELLRRAVELAKFGKKDEARLLLADACIVNPFNEKAWLWRASLAPTMAEAIAWLERVLVLNPQNETANNWMRRLRPSAPTVYCVAPEAEPAAEAGWTCPLCSYESTAELSRCTECGGITSLDMALLESNTGAREMQMKHASEHYAQMFASGDTVSGYYLALAQLNLHRSYEAYTALLRYLKTTPEDQEALAAVEVLRRRKLILTIDDSATVRSVVTDSLERAGYRCANAISGIDAIGFLRGEDVPDFILTDVSMPVMDGYQLCRAIKQMPNVKHVPIIMLSGNDGFVDKVKGKMAGAADYLIKPFNTLTLTRTIQKLTPAGGK
jgi:CheY-like chemotaxis protein